MCGITVMRTGCVFRAKTFQLNPSQNNPCTTTAVTDLPDEVLRLRMYKTT